MSVLRMVFLVGCSLALAAPAAAGDPAYVGVKKCKKCHVKQYKSWSKTHKAKAMDSLKPNAAADAKTKAGLDPAKDYTTDKACLACHTTGYGKTGGYGGADAKADEVGVVGCESCHGPGGDYLADDRHSTKNKKFKSADLAQYGFVGKTPEKQCLTCHNKDNPFHKPFDYEKGKKKGAHDSYPLKYEH